MKISVLIFAKDEIEIFKKIIAKASDENFCDELVVILDKDYQPEIYQMAKKYQAKIFVHQLTNFRDHKNYGISKTKYDWVLLIDADEEIDAELAQSLSNIKNSLEKEKYAGYNIAFKTLFFGHWLKYSGVYPDWHVRFFNKTRAKYEHIIHEILKVDGKIKNMRGHIIHHSFRNRRQWLKKIELYTDLEAKNLIKKGRRFSLIYLFGKPLKEFYWRFIQLRGFLDGLVGLQFALMSAYYRFKTAMKIRKIDSRSKSGMTKGKNENCH